MGAQLVFSSVSPLKENGVRRKTLILHASNWLQNWCWQQRFGFCDYGSLLKDQHLPGRGGSNSFGEVQVWLAWLQCCAGGTDAGRTGQEAKEQELPFVRENLDAWSSAWG